MSLQPIRKHSHYFKSVEGLSVVDVYRTLELFNVTDPCLQHAIKKLLMAGGRGDKAKAGWDALKDVQEAIDTLTRWQEMRGEDANRAGRVSTLIAESYGGTAPSVRDQIAGAAQEPRDPRFCTTPLMGACRGCSGPCTRVDHCPGNDGKGEQHAQAQG